ncbi:unnamed protein product [Durusdinium trenchii]|uniref:Uncharacterized protein n=1 Tax=Durusdinium trenchii TaxID=1381693 RepID=A0ABP0I8W3_9DINO
MIWLAKLVSRPFDRVLQLSFHILWLELDLLVERFATLLPGLPGFTGSVRHYGRMAVEAFFVAEAIQWLSTAMVLLCFWLFYALCLPPTAVSYPFVIDWSSDIYAASAVGLAQQDGGLSVACKEVPMQPIPDHVSALEMHFVTSEMTPPLPGLYKLELLDLNNSITEAAWRPLLPKVTSTFSSTLIALGLREPQSWSRVAAVDLEELRDKISAARLCLQPPVRSMETSLHVFYKLRGFYRFVQRWPLLWSAVLVLCTGTVTWSLLCILLVILVLRRRQGRQVSEPELEVEDRITDAKTVVSDVFKQSLCKVEEASTQLVEAVKDPDLQVTAASALSGAVALGAGGGCAGLITGSVAGGACGIVPAIFTFGLSIPVGVVLGGGAGAAAGTALGGTAGAMLGTLLGRRYVHHRSANPDSPQSRKDL